MLDRMPDDVEVELNAEELDRLSRSKLAPERVVDSAADKPASEKKAEPVRVSAPVVPRTPIPSRFTTAHRYTLIAAVLAVTGGLFAFQHDDASPSPHRTRWIPLPEKDAEVADEPQPIAVGSPVRIRNEFDHSEVFEFPPGTTLPDARKHVAQILMQRAQERRAAMNPSAR